MPDAGPGRPRRSRREERKEETRAELIVAAARVFAERGFNRTSLQDIAREAGYSTGAIYWHFSGKDDLFLAVFDAYTQTRLGELDAVHEQAGGGLPGLARAYAEQWMTRLEQAPELLMLPLEFLVHAWRNPPVREEFGKRLGYARQAFADVIREEAEADGLSLPMPPDQLATVLREMGVGLALAKLADPKAVPDDLLGVFVEEFFRLLYQSQGL
jgi:AcrR family transcriptional regulator